MVKKGGYRYIKSNKKSIINTTNSKRSIAVKIKRKKRTATRTKRKMKRKTKKRKKRRKSKKTGFLNF